MATDMAKVRKFEDGLKLSIWGKIVGLLLQDMDSMVRTTMAIEKEIDVAKRIRDAGVSGKKNENRFSSGSGKRQWLPFHEDLQDKAAAIRAKAKLGLLAR